MVQFANGLGKPEPERKRGWGRLGALARHIELLISQTSRSHNPSWVDDNPHPYIMHHGDKKISGAGRPPFRGRGRGAVAWTCATTADSHRQGRTEVFRESNAHLIPIPGIRVLSSQLTMGNEIVHCSACGLRLRSGDFEQGGAVR